MNNDTSGAVASNAELGLSEEGVARLLPRINHRPGMVGYECYSFGDVAHAVRAAVRAERERCEAPRWIPVTERLPEKNTEVLIAFAGQCSIPATGQYTGSAFDSHGWCYPAENRGSGNDGEDPVVTHWMALPEVPNTQVQRRPD